MNPATDTNIKNKEYIKELQSYLRLIANFDKRIPLVAIDGIYSLKTYAAVSAFQANYNLPVTGETDEETWNEIYKHYKIISENTSPAVAINGFGPSCNIIRIGDKGYNVYFLQVMIKAISSRFYNIDSVDINGVYDNKTDLAVKKLQTAALLDTTGVDKQCWDSIAGLYNALISCN